MELNRNRATGFFERRVGLGLINFVSDSSPLIVACSGGPDSSAALIAVVRVRERAGGGEVVAATFDHGLRPQVENDADIEFVQTLAGKMGVRSVVGKATEGFGTSEAAARKARYIWLGRVALEMSARACVSGHTLNDQAETVLLRLARGTGLTGASSMTNDAPWPFTLSGSTAGCDLPSLRLLRPLLNLRRQEIEEYLDALGLDAEGLNPRLDLSNETLEFSRNRVRHRVLPELRRLNPRVEEALAGFARRARRDDLALEAWAEAEWERLVYVGRSEVVIDRHSLYELPQAVAMRILRRAGKQLGLALDSSQLEALWNASSTSGVKLKLAGGAAFTDATDLRFLRYVSALVD
uniref:tRNA(Ile)-lysidine synthase n=1 Tax=uncultured Chloroflexi bacterium HF0200_09I09 TaxID=710736 RepID=E0XU81_9CHLR|nr:predicted ATPase of the PP-loop superfamily implicated in cell cycle control [uncultured Chloroflexi bacterium HF0200_09I09]